MKLDAVLSYVLAVLEGGIAGACFYRAGKTKETKRKAAWYIASTAWFVLSLLDSMTGSHKLREAREAADAEAGPAF